MIYIKLRKIQSSRPTHELFKHLLYIAEDMQLSANRKHLTVEDRSLKRFKADDMGGWDTKHV